MKLGLALSGGGFRAAFFHLGVMAELSRRGLLKHVRVISTVSGGSILGAYYYIYLMGLLQAEAPTVDPDAELRSLMNTIEEDFSQSVEKNMRLLTFARMQSNVRMMSPTYSRTDRFGDLLDEHFYRPAWRRSIDPQRATAITMRELPVANLGSDAPIDPRKGKLLRGVQVPLLVINATSLNSGHGWRFDPFTMGEALPTDDTEWEIDRSLVFAPPQRYADITGKQSNLRVGDAVAASAAVPGLFQPLAISNMYPDARVQLADGGVSQNQGVDALVDEHCTHAIASDAGGQLGGSPGAPSWSIGVLGRSAGIQYGRVRQIGLQRLFTALGTTRTALVHTRMGVRDEPLGWIDETDTPVPAPELIPAPPRDPAPPVVDPEVQRLLADMRTDLDSFSQVEVQSLMCAGYRQAAVTISRTPGIDELCDQPGPVTFDFTDITPWLLVSPTGRYGRQLKAARSRLFKSFRLLWPLQLFLVVTVAGLIAGIAKYRHGLSHGWAVSWSWFRSTADLPIIRDALGWGPVKTATGWLPERVAGGWIVFLTVIIPLGAYLFIRYVPARARSWVASRLRRSVPILDTLTSIIRGFVAVLAWVVVWVSLATSDRLFRWYGQTSKLGTPPVPPSGDPGA
jgi:predicted acylesterase/phospholipase RssA